MASINEDADILGNLFVRGAANVGGFVRSLTSLLVSDGAATPTFPGLVAFAFNPSTTGYAAALGTLGIRTDSSPPQLWQKTTAPDAGWTQVVGGGAAISGSTLTLTGDITPPSIGPGSVDNYSPTGVANCAHIRQAVDVAGATLTGLNSQPNGRLIQVTNLGAGTLRIAHESASSSAANRFNLPNDLDVYLPPECGIWLGFDGAANRWRPWALSTDRFVFLEADLLSLTDIAGGAGVGTLRARAGDPNGIVSGQVGDLIVDISTPALWQNLTGGTVWGQIGASSGGTDPGWFGDGADGNVTIAAGTTTLTRDTFYNNLTLNAGATLNPDGYGVWVKGTLTFANATSIIGSIVQNGGNGAGGVGGAGGTGRSTVGRPLPGSQAGGAGQAVNTIPGNPGTAANPCPPDYAGITGGAGGTGTAAGGAGGTSTSLGAGLGGIQMVEYAISGKARGINNFAIGPGGGGGAGQSGGGGGGGGAGGAYTVVCARVVAAGAGGVIHADGGNGGNGQAGGTTGGGGGGAGGVSVLVYSASTGGLPTVRAAGGTGGTPGGAGGSTAGANGAAGKAYTYQVG